MITPSLKRLSPAIALLALFLVNCSFDAADRPEESSGAAWDLGNADSSNTNNQNNENNGNSSNNATNSATNSANNTNSSTNNTTNNVADAGVDMPAPVDMASADMAPDVSVPDMSAGPCVNNTECASGLVCCPDLQGVGACQADCLVGGLCDTEMDCDGNDKCCDLSGIGVQSKICAITCGGGMSGTACTTNRDCMNQQVCCPGFNGQNQCASRCLSGGICEMDSDCLGSKVCCNTFGGKQCFDRCFP